MKWFSLIGLAAGALLLVGACAGSRAPSEQLTRTRTAISAADAVDGTYPQAALHLRMARSQLEEAEQMIEGQAYDSAERLLQRAEADAELAQVLARQAETRQHAVQARRKVAQLRTQIEGGGETR